jgi:hypothetical protein
MSVLQPNTYSVTREVALCDEQQAQRFEETLSALVVLNGIKYVSRNQSMIIRILTAEQYESALSDENVTSESAKAGLDEYIEGSKNDYMRTTITSIFPTGPENGQRFISFGTPPDIRRHLNSERHELLGMIGSVAFSDGTPPVSVLSCKAPEVQMAIDQLLGLGLIGSEIIISPPVPVKVNR